MRRILFMSVLLAGLSAFGQSKFDEQLPDKPVYTPEIVDSVYGITLYEPLNMAMGGDSVRMVNGYAAQNWIEDYYEDGTLLHKGYYIDGQLKVYKNYYPDGTLERNFVNVDGYRSKVTLYYQNGNIKSQVTYKDGAAQVWTDYFMNGNIEYYEEYHKSMMYHIAKRSYYESGQAESLFELVNKKKLDYTQNDFYSSGKKRMAGTLRYDKDAYDYFKTGKWVYFNEGGNPIKDETYQDGKLLKTNKY
jgi:antitoxin component YwqK of YwqJK toxin-antitoxin module